MLYKLCICGAAVTTSAYMMTGAAVRPQAAVRAGVPAMDETILEKALAGELEEEGAENVFMSEVGWAYYLDKEAGSSYAMNERFSLAEDGYVTPDVFSSPVDVVSSWIDSLKNKVAADPLETAFPTISNDMSGARSYPKGLNEINARTIKPKTKDMDAKLRITGIPGFNFFGSPSSKQDL